MDSGSEIEGRQRAFRGSRFARAARPDAEEVPLLVARLAAEGLLDRAGRDLVLEHLAGLDREGPSREVAESLHVAIRDQLALIEPALPHADVKAVPVFASSDLDVQPQALARPRRAGSVSLRRRPTPAKLPPRALEVLADERVGPLVARALGAAHAVDREPVVAAKPRVIATEGEVQPVIAPVDPLLPPAAALLDAPLPLPALAAAQADALLPVPAALAAASKRPPARVARAADHLYAAEAPRLEWGQAVRDAVLAEVRGLLEEVLARPAADPDATEGMTPSFWLDRRAELRARVGEAPPVQVVPFVDPVGAGLGSSSAPSFEAGVQIQSWLPLGPSAVRNGQTSFNSTISGRVAGIAGGAGATPLYVATANGGVFRSDDQGRSWRPLSDALDFDPQGVPLVDSLACGAIAVDPANTERIYVGTGEGSTRYIGWVTGVPTAFMGVGPLLFDGTTRQWTRETATPSLAGAAFYEIVADPWFLGRAVGATSQGLYRRAPGLFPGSSVWTQATLVAGATAAALTGGFTSVVAVRTGFLATRYYAVGALAALPAQMGLLTSTNGATWTALAPLPAAAAAAGTRVRLAVVPPTATRPTILYAFTAGGQLWRWDANATTGTWGRVTGVPAFTGFLTYSMAIAVSPQDPQQVWIAGGSTNTGEAELSVLTLSASVVGGVTTWFVASTVPQGTNVHSDVHALWFDPSDPGRMFVGTDGGVFERGGPGWFRGRNVGLSSLTMTRLGQHPTEPAVLYGGTQDNGTLLWSGDLFWERVASGDGGCVVVRPDSPREVLQGYVTGILDARTGARVPNTNKSYDGGLNWVGTDIVANGMLFYHQLVGCPTDPSLVASGGNQVVLSRSFGEPGSWYAVGGITLAGSITALAFASDTLLYVGTHTGWVYLVQLLLKGGGGLVEQWITAALHPAALPWAPLAWVTDIAVDPQDTTGRSIFVSLGGAGNRNHVWHYDGTNWAARGGTVTPFGDRRLLDAQVSALVAIPGTPEIYAGTDVGVWWSIDGGNQWRPCSRGLPESAVVDLVYHPVSYSLRAALFGRGVYELSLAAVRHAASEPYVRANALDINRRWPTEGHVHPVTLATMDLLHSPDIKVDIPDGNGAFRLWPGVVDAYRFTRHVDGSDFVPTVHFAQPEIASMVYIKVNNRGVGAGGVRVVALVSCVSEVTPTIDLGAVAQLIDAPQASAEIADTWSRPSWRLVGIGDVLDVRAAEPKVAVFRLGSRLLPSEHELPGPGQGLGVPRVLLVFAHPHGASTAAMRGYAYVPDLVRDNPRVAARQIRVIRHDQRGDMGWPLDVPSPDSDPDA